MMRTSFLIREINGSRLPSMVSSMMMQRRARSVEAYASIQNGGVTKEEDAEVQEARPTKDIPGPRAWPLIGNMFRFMPYIGEYGNVDLLTQLRMMRDKYGNMVRLDGIVNRPPCVFLFSPDLCEKMYRVQGNWPIRLAMECLHYYRQSREHIYDGQYGVATSQGKLWHDFRSKVNPHMMQPRTVKVHVAQISEVTSEFVEKMRTLRDPKTLETPANFANELHKWALESICSIALNCRLGCLKPNLPADSEPQIMIECVHEMFELMYRLEVLPSLWKLYHTRNLKRFFRVLDTLNGISTKHINRAKAKLQEMPSNQKDLHEGSILEKLLSIDEQTAYVMALDMLTAGVDTTGNMTGALMYYIATNPEKQDKLREEAMSVLPDKTSPVTAEILHETKYAKACIKESLRLFPVSIGNLRTMQTDVSIGGYKIPKGYNLVACHPLISRDSTHFPQPEEYIPERWLRGNTEFPSAKDANPFSYMPFGFGSRTCLGRRFAEMEMETMLLTVIRNFRIEWHHEPLMCKSRFINMLGSPMQYKLIDL